MQKLIIAATVALATLNSFAADGAESKKSKVAPPTSPGAQTNCILKAADTLPKIAGMKIGNTRTTEMPTPAGWQGAGPPLRVELDFVAAGQSATWAYLCAVTATGQAIVQRLAE
jgi:hypothetical protein